MVLCNDNHFLAVVLAKRRNVCKERINGSSAVHLWPVNFVSAAAAGRWEKKRLDDAALSFMLTGNVLLN